MKILELGWEELPGLPEYYKEQVSLGVYTLYEDSTGEYWLRTARNIEIPIWWHLSPSGGALSWFEIKSPSRTPTALVKFKIPSRIRKNYLKLSLK